MNLLPPPNTPLRVLPLPALSPRAQEQLTRVSACLYVVNRPEIQAHVLLAGYTPEIHREGAYRASLVSGDRSFGEWRLWRSLRPSRDPDAPELVAELQRFVDRWRPRVAAAVAEVPDAEDRGELEGYLGDELERPSRTWTAKTWVACVEGLADVPLPFYQDPWAALVAQGIEEELPRFHEVLKKVQGIIEAAPLDADELADIQASREECVTYLEAWLKERRAQFAPRFTEETLTLLALGARPPPPLPPGVPLEVLARFRFVGEA